MSNKIKVILMAAAVSSMVLTQGVSAAQFDDGEQIFTDGTESSDATGSVAPWQVPLRSRPKRRLRSLWRKKRRLLRFVKSAE